MGTNDSTRSRAEQQGCLLPLRHRVSHSLEDVWMYWGLRILLDLGDVIKPKTYWMQKVRLGMRFGPKIKEALEGFHQVPIITMEELNTPF